MSHPKIKGFYGNRQQTKIALNFYWDGNKHDKELKKVVRIRLKFELGQKN